MNNQMGGYSDLLVWRFGMDLVVEIYELTKRFPNEERFGLTSQMRRSAVSIPSNISEGYRRTTDADFLQFLSISFGSASELETQCLIAFRLNYFTSDQYHRVDALIKSVLRLLNGFIKSRKNKQN